MSAQHTDPTEPATLPYDATEAVVSVSWFKRQATPLAAIAVFILSVMGAVLMMPPSRYPELAYVFAAPAVFWAYRAPSWRWFLGSVLGAQMVAWTLTLSWLGNVTWAALTGGVDARAARHAPVSAMQRSHWYVALAGCRER